MSLIDRAKDEQFAKLMEDSEAARLHEQEELALEQQRFEVITHQLTVVAAKLDEPLEPLTEAVSLPHYYLLGDVVIMVQQFRIGAEKPDPSRPRVVTMSYCTYLMAVDGRKRLVHRKIGTLKWLGYPGIAEAITQAPADYVFTATEVRKLIPQLG